MHFLPYIVKYKFLAISDHVEVSLIKWYVAQLKLLTFLWDDMVLRKVNLSNQIYKMNLCIPEANHPSLTPHAIHVLS